MNQFNGLLQKVLSIITGYLSNVICVTLSQMITNYSLIYVIQHFLFFFFSFLFFFLSSKVMSIFKSFLPSFSFEYSKGGEFQQLRMLYDKKEL